MFKGSRKCTEFLALFALPQKRNKYVGIFLFHGKLQAPYRKIEILNDQCSLLGSAKL